MGRRTNGDGSIYRDGDRWRAAVTLPNGQRKRFRARTKEEAAALLRTAQAQQSAGTLAIDSRTTLGAYLDQWLEWRRDLVRPTTWRAHEVLVRVHISPDPIARRPIGKLTTGDVDAFLTRLGRKKYRTQRGSASSNGDVERTLSPRSVQMVLNLLRASTEQARKWGYVSVNAANDATSPRVPEPVRNPFTAEEAKRILAVAKSHRLGAFFTVAIALGLRPGEGLALAWDDIELDAEHPRLVVRHTLTRDLGGRLTLAPPKTRRSARTIALPPSCVLALRERRRAQLRERLLSGPEWNEPIPGLVFESALGSPIDKDNIGAVFDRLLVAANVPRRRLYEARHTAATLLLAQGVHPRIVMELLGHSTIKLTMDTYSHVMPALQREAADAIERALG